jgi:hypothetical protein
VVQFILVALLCVLSVDDVCRQGVRVVDSVNVTIARDETSHSLAGDGTSVGEAATHTREPHESKAAEITVRLPLTETAGKTAVIVKFQAHSGSRTARLLEVQSVQEHLE